MSGDLAHALSIDVEDYFQVLNLRSVVRREDWDDIELRCGDSTRRILDLCDRHGAKATFFFLGWIAERLPDLVADVVSAGHELGSHGYDHQLLGELGEQGFAADLQRTAEILAEHGGLRPQLFRACTWSIDESTTWALPILRRAGIDIDSSIFPVAHPDYGISSAPTSPFRIDLGATGALLEFPPLTRQVFGRRLPVGGGGYLRLFPLGVLLSTLRQCDARGIPGCIYLHPWEVDPDQPRLGLKGLRAFRHYVNLHRTLPKLEALLERHRFLGLRACLREYDSTSSEYPTLTLDDLSRKSRGL